MESARASLRASMTRPLPSDGTSRPAWEGIPPRTYSVVTGFFPEVSPKETWTTNPRPLLVCGTAQDPDTGVYFCRIAYGTSSHIDKSHPSDLVVGNLSALDRLGLKKPTRFLIHSGQQMAIMPWTSEFFRPWSGYKTPILSILPDDMQRYVGFTLSNLSNLPQF